MSSNQSDSAWQANNRLDLSAIREHPFISGLDFHQTIESTNRRAMEIVTENEWDLPLLIVTESQTAGRGRGNNKWHSAQGALTFSLMIDITHWNLNPEQGSLISLMTGLAVCQTLAPILAEHRVQLKWPNDVLVDGSKVCGILVETHAAMPGRIVIGVGLNVNNPVNASAYRLPATSLRELSGSDFPITDILLTILTNLSKMLDNLQSETLSAAWQQFCVLNGKYVQLELPGETVRGECGGIDEDGALLLITDTGLKRFYSGTVLSYE